MQEPNAGAGPGKTGKGGKGEFVPTEEQILKELKQREQRASYMKSDKAKEQRKKYQQKRYAEAKAMRDYMKANPDVVEALKTKHNL